MKKLLLATAALVALPALAQAQSPDPGFYIGGQGGLNWMFNSTVNPPGPVNNINLAPQTGWAAGGVIGYDFIGPRVELEGMFRQNNANVNFTAGGTGFGGFGVNIQQTSVMANVLYDFAQGSFTPYIGAGAGVAFINASAFGVPSNTPQFAYQGMLGLAYRIDSNWRVNLEGRYFGTTTPQVGGGSGFQNNNFSLLAGIQYKFGSSPPPPPPPAPAVAPPSFMVFFDWDRSNLSQQALNTIKQAAAAFKSKGNARITATGHTDTSGPEAYNMALSLRRANAVKDALVREGVPAQAITVIGRGEAGLLVKTADGVREPQNRRVEIVIQ